MLPAVIALLCLSAATGGPSTLFDDRDKVIILNKDDYKTGLYTGDKAHVFMLYSSWCGHCQRFAPTYIELADYVHKWFPIVDITGVDCVYDVDVCRVFNVEGYPTVRFIAPTTNTSSVGVSFNGDRSIPNLVTWIIEQIQAVAPRPSKWPILSTLTVEEVVSLQQAGSKPPLVVIAIYDNDVIIAKQVILNLNGKVKVRWVSLSDDAAKKLGSDQPGLTIVGNKGEVSHVSKMGGSVEEIEKAIESLPIAKGKQSEGGEEEEGDDEDKGTEKKIKYVNTNLQYKLFELDMQSAVNNAFYTEVALKSDFTAKDLLNLKNFLSAVNRCGSWSPDYKQHIAHVRKSLKDKTSLNNKEWAGILDTAADNGYPRNSTWVGCQGSMPNTRGYTCSVWLLFHTMLSSCHETAPGSVFVLKAIHGYIDSFFTCSHCRKHFLAMAEEMDILSITNDKFAILTFWDAHNRVNKRLSTVTHDPYFPKLQYPPDKVCSQCRKPDNSFDTERVFQFLLSHYRKVLTPYGKVRKFTGRRKGSRLGKNSKYRKGLEKYRGD